MKLSILEYSAKSKDFGDRVKEELFEEDLKQKLCRDNYKELFHKLLCWEEREHIEILGKRCKYLLYSTEYFYYMISLR